jgi:hypothetical protein
MHRLLVVFAQAFCGWKGAFLNEATEGDGKAEGAWKN